MACVSFHLARLLKWIFLRVKAVLYCVQGEMHFLTNSNYSIFPQTQTYRRHKLVRTPDSRNLVFIQNLLGKPLHRLIPFHKTDISDIKRKQHQRLVPIDIVILEEQDQSDQTDGIEETVPEQRPPGQREHCLRKQRTHANHEEDIEYRRPNDGSDTDVVETHEDAYHASEEFGRRTPGRHEGRPGHVVLDVQLLDDDVQGGHEELIADDGERDEHVHHPQDVQHDGARATLLLGEEVPGEERVRLVERVVVCRERGERGVGLYVDVFVGVLRDDGALEEHPWHAEERDAEGHSGGWWIIFTARPGADWNWRRSIRDQACRYAQRASFRTATLWLLSMCGRNTMS